VSDQETNLTNVELMHVALHANQQGRTRDAIESLKQILERDADDAKAIYMLAALHAEIGMTDQAVTEMTRAVELDPTLITAHFQLGLLHYLAARYEEAAIAWQALDETIELKCLYLFKSGLLALVEGQYEDGIQLVESGIENNQFNEALNNDMRRIVDGVRGRLSDLNVADAKNEQEAAVMVAKNAVRPSDLSAYQQKDSD
jgi:tetratricopeptide (TPR) repeat protein